MVNCILKLTFFSKMLYSPLGYFSKNYGKSLGGTWPDCPSLSKSDLPVIKAIWNYKIMRNNVQRPGLYS